MHLQNADLEATEPLLKKEMSQWPKAEPGHGSSESSESQNSTHDFPIGKSSYNLLPS